MTRPQACIMYLAILIAGCFPIAWTVAALLDGLPKQIVCVLAGSVWVNVLLAHWFASKWGVRE